MVEQEDEDLRFFNRAFFEYKTSFIPRRCYTTRRLIWGKAVRARRVITGPGEDLVEDRWYHRDEGLLLLLKSPNTKY